MMRAVLAHEPDRGRAVRWDDRDSARETGRALRFRGRAGISVAAMLGWL